MSSLAKVTKEPAANQFIMLGCFTLVICNLGRIFIKKTRIILPSVIGICLALSYHHWNYQVLKFSLAVKDCRALIAVSLGAIQMVQLELVDWPPLWYLLALPITGAPEPLPLAVSYLQPPNPSHDGFEVSLPAARRKRDVSPSLL